MENLPYFKQWEFLHNFKKVEQLAWIKLYMFIVHHFATDFSSRHTVGGNHVSVVLSQRRDTIAQWWYYASQRCDTSWHASFRHRKKYQWDLFLEVFFLFFFFSKLIFPHNVKDSHLCDTITYLWTLEWRKVSYRHDTWY